jgi:hypothetical protein
VKAICHIYWIDKLLKALKKEKKKRQKRGKKIKGKRS